MSTQYIINFKNDSFEDSISGYAELYKSNFNIPILEVRTYENKNDKMNQNIFYQILSKNINITFEDENTKCIISYFDKSNYIIFDKNSSSSYTLFKTNLINMINSTFETIYYSSGNIMYAGNVLNIQENDIIVDKKPHGNGILYYNSPGNKIKYSGEFENGFIDGCGTFYNKSGNVNLKVNNISNGIPTQKGTLNLNFKYKTDSIKIDFFTVWDKLEIFFEEDKKTIVLSNNFLDILINKLYNFSDIPMEELYFNDKPNNEKLTEVWKIVNTIKKDNDSKYNNLMKINCINNTVLIGLCISIIINIIINITN
jgi:hypothetical protein